MQETETEWRVEVVVLVEVVVGNSDILATY